MVIRRLHSADRPQRMVTTASMAGIRKLLRQSQETQFTPLFGVTIAAPEAVAEEAAATQAV